MTRSTGTPTDAHAHIEQACDTLERLAIAVQRCWQVDFREAWDTEPLVKPPPDPHAPPVPDHEFDERGATTLRGRYQASLRKVAVATKTLIDHTPVEADNALDPIAVILDARNPWREDHVDPATGEILFPTRAPHELPTVPRETAQDALLGLASMFGQLARQADTLTPDERRATVEAARQTTAALGTRGCLPRDWGKKVRKRRAPAKRCKADGCKGEDGKPRPAAPGRPWCWACYKRSQRQRQAAS